MIFLAEQSFVSTNSGSDSGERKEVECAIDNPLLDDCKCIVPEQRLRRSKMFIDSRTVVYATSFFENHRYHRLILAQDIISVIRFCSDDYESDYHLLLSDVESFDSRYSSSMCVSWMFSLLVSPVAAMDTEGTRLDLPIMIRGAT
jgi:hypothetical protein